MNWAYPFDRALASPDRQITVLHTALGTKGLVIADRRGKREVNRSYYHAGAYQYRRGRRTNVLVTGRLRSARVPGGRSYRGLVQHRGACRVCLFQDCTRRIGAEGGGPGLGMGGG